MDGASIPAIAFVIAASYFYVGHTTAYVIVLLWVTGLSLMVDNRYIRASVGVCRRGH